MTPCASLQSNTDVAPVTAQVDGISREEWDSTVAQFDDATLMQTWSYGAARWGDRNLSYLRLKRDGQTVAAAQVIIRRIPFLNSGLAYIKAGPMWRRREMPADQDALRQVLAALRSEYEVKRGLFLRVFPFDTHHSAPHLRNTYQHEGFTRDFSIGRPRTVYVDLAHSLEELRLGMKPTWRRNLVLAERNELTIDHGTGMDLFGVFEKLYREMLRRKNIVGVVGIHYYRAMQQTLPEPFKLRIMICSHQGCPVAGLAVPCLGNTVQNLLAATGDQGLQLRASYLLHWRMLEWAKANGFRWYDLDVTGDAYHGISQFKTGLAGRLGWESEYAGQFHTCENLISYVSVMTAERAREVAARARSKAARLKRSRRDDS